MNKQIAIQNAIEDVNLAFKQLEFAIKLMCYCENNDLDKSKFDGDITLKFRKENKVFSDNSFATYEEIIKHSQINVGICFGASAIALDAAFEAAGFSCKKRPLDNIRSIVYMIRCAFAHNIADPKWEVKGDFLKQISLVLEEETILIDLNQLNGRSFRYDDVGDLPNWYRIKNASLDIIKELQKHNAELKKKI